MICKHNVLYKCPFEWDQITPELPHNNYLWHTGLGTLVMVGVDPFLSFCQEWIFLQIVTV